MKFLWEKRRQVYIILMLLIVIDPALSIIALADRTHKLRAPKPHPTLVLSPSQNPPPPNTLLSPQKSMLTPLPNN